MSMSCKFCFITTQGDVKKAVLKHIIISLALNLSNRCIILVPFVFQDRVHVSLTGPPGPSVVVDVDNQELKPEIEAVTTTVDVNHNKLQMRNHVVETVVSLKTFLNIATDKLHYYRLNPTGYSHPGLLH